MKRVEVAADEPMPVKVSWNKGELAGSKPPLRIKHVWSIRTKLQVEGRTRDLAMFNLAIDSKLRGCDRCSTRPRNRPGYGTPQENRTCGPVRIE